MIWSDCIIFIETKLTVCEETNLVFSHLVLWPSNNHFILLYDFILMMLKFCVGDACLYPDLDTRAAHKCQESHKPVNVFYGVEDPDTEASENLTCLICAKAVFAGTPTTRVTSMAVTKSEEACHTTTISM